MTQPNGPTETQLEAYRQFSAMMYEYEALISAKMEVGHLPFDYGYELLAKMDEWREEGARKLHEEEAK